MAMDVRHADLPQLAREAADLGRRAEQQFGALTARQLNWRPSPDEWSVGQCLDHLIVATTTYFPQLREIQAGTKRATFWERVPLLPSLFGPWLIRLLSPERSAKVRAPAVFRPTECLIDPQIVPTFAATQQELVRFMAGTAPRDLDRIVTSPASRFVTYDLLDAYRIIVVHGQLHLQQAQRVTEQAAFPGRN
jgi:DinB superfamily